jgi:hypothetical protein
MKPMKIIDGYNDVYDYHEQQHDDVWQHKDYSDKKMNYLHCSAEIDVSGSNEEFIHQS